MPKNTGRSGAVEGIRQFRPPDGFLSGDRILRTLHSVPLRARVMGSLASTTFRDEALSGRGDDAFIGWTVRFVGNPVATSTLVRGESSVVTDYADDGTFTFGALSTATILGDEFDVIPPWLAGDVWNYTSVNITMAAGTTGAINEHEVLTVTGLCRIKGLIVCSTSLTSGGAPTIAFGDGAADLVDNIINQTTALNIDAPMIWHSSTPSANAPAAVNAIWDVVSNGSDLGYEIATATLTGGVLEFHFWWQGYTAGSSCAPATGAAGAI